MNAQADSQFQSARPQAVGALGIGIAVKCRCLPPACENPRTGSDAEAQKTGCNQERLQLAGKGAGEAQIVEPGQGEGAGGSNAP